MCVVFNNNRKLFVCSCVLPCRVLILGSNRTIKMAKYILIVLLVLAGIGSAEAQKSKKPTKKSAEIEENGPVSTMTYGITTNTNSDLLGGFVFRHTKTLPRLFKGSQQARYLALEIVETTHPKELSSPSFSGNRFTYGKANYLFSIRPQYGREIVFFNKSPDEGISISGIFAVGPTIGIIKPYYIQYAAGRTIQSVPFDPFKHSRSEILGAGGFFQGFSDAKIALGINAKAAVNFELSAFRNNMTGLEIGVLAEGFGKTVPIMATINPESEINRSYFISGYITLYFGTRRAL